LDDDQHDDDLVHPVHWRRLDRKMQFSLVDTPNGVTIISVES
jgi:hypothetical protein